jgi:dihydrofolate reductase
MKVVLVLVSTLNGKITRGDDPEVRHWSSKSDQDYYSRVWKDSRLIVMGSYTYTQNIITASPKRLIIVMTRRPLEHIGQEIPGQLEFSDESPREIYERLQRSGNPVLTLVGGSSLATSFFRESLIDELWLTIEPKLFGQGINLISETDFDVTLRLADIQKVNEEGTLITKYYIVR